MLMRFLRYCTRLFSAWHCVGVFEYYYGQANCSNRVFFYLFENEFSERKVKIQADGDDYLRYDSVREHRQTVRNLYFYKARITPWLLGRNDPEIPNFKNNNCDKRAFLNALKDKGPNIVVRDGAK
jgi:hypothetical protein